MRKLLAVFFAFSSSFSFGQNVGIGTTLPVAKLQINANSSTASPSLLIVDSTGFARIGLQNVSSTQYWMLAGYASPSDLTTSYFHVYNTQAGRNLLTVRGNGNMGVDLATAPIEKLEIGSGNIKLNSSDKGILLNAGDRPIITRGWDPFTSGIYSGVGRWGMFMEPNRLVAGVPDAAGKGFSVATYDAASNVSKTLLTVTQDGNTDVNNKLTNTSRTGGANLLPLAYGSVENNGTIKTGTNNFTITKYGTGIYIINVNGENFSQDTHIITITPYYPGSIFTSVIKNTVISPTGAVVYTISPSSNLVDCAFFFIMYKP